MDEKEKFVKPYGDTQDDGIIQMSFTIPLSLPLSREVAKRVVREMGLVDENIVYEKDIYGFTFFIVYGKFNKYIDTSKIKIKVEEIKKLDYFEIEKIMEEKLDRKIKIIACTLGTDAHTVGLDAIINAKGYNGDNGLERYKGFEILNLGSQVPHEFLIQKIKEFKPNVVLISQTVTQKNIHLKNLTLLSELLEAENLRDKILLICGGYKITPELAHELGYDMGFGANTYPSQVAYYIVNEVIKRNLLNKWS
ncbi:MAG TPA: OAM dimerization domain-containing protein [Caldisericia bacterium]|nr:OAM dimerization domain-containing protein [Caldisericia bacterium]HOL82401.1 OAM dimerization domain-containing protein [Caldisericia bacterium]HPC56434.1 OAM dimerization domain-containing protein [Caldisericia bacterium]HRT36921.1 OAM dimerization domain-containing protein [Caldisericia bacterium]HRU73525.1 OAM dimerization domain-containing protein [Caldisericia bacterium]